MFILRIQRMNALNRYGMCQNVNFDNVSSFLKKAVLLVSLKKLQNCVYTSLKRTTLFLFYTQTCLNSNSNY